MPAASKICVKSAEARSLRHLRSRTPSRRLWARTTAILMLGTGATAAQVRSVLSVSRNTLTRWKSRWIQGGPFRLPDAPRSGRPPRANSKYVGEMLRVVREDPRDFGYAFRRWTAPRLAEYLAQETGIRVTDAWLAELLRTHGFVWRKTKRTIRNLQDPVATQRAQRQLRRLKKGFCGREPIMSCGSETA